MKRKLLSLALVLVMALSLMPTTVFAADAADFEEGAGGLASSTVEIECLHLAGCIDGQHDPNCPKYVAPAVPEVPEQEPVTPEEPEQLPETPQEPVVQSPVTSAPPAVQAPAASVQPSLDEGNGSGEENPSVPSNGGLTIDKNAGEKETPNADAQATCPPHTLTKVERVPATCMSTGTEEHWHCDKCNNDFSVNNINATQVADALTIPKTETHDWSNKNSQCAVAGCTATCDHTKDTNKNDATCSVCGAAYLEAKGCGHYTERTRVTRGEATCGKNGYAMATGDEAWYCSQCKGYYTTKDGNTKVTVTVTAATGKHVRKDGTVTTTSASGHKCTCDTCGDEFVEAHTFGDDNICDICNYDRTSSPVTPSPSDYISISSAYVNSYSISVTWYSTLPEGTVFDIWVDSEVRRSVTPSKSSSGYFSYTVEYSYYLGDRYYDVTVRSGSISSGTTRAYNPDYDWDHDYWYDHYYPNRYPNSTPSTNSYGIPYASQVNGRYSAAEAIRILRNKNQASLQNDLMNSSSALDSFERLESAVKSANNVSVNVSSSGSSVPSPIRGKVSISGAAFNASSTNSTVRLVVDAPSVNRYAGRGYQFSMSLNGVGGDSSLDVPVVVSMPLPADISATYVKVLHYHNSSVPTVISPKVSGGRISFPLTGFSDFVITDGTVPNYTYVSDGYGGYYVPVGNVPRRSLVDEHLSVILPIIASTPVSGYVYSDVPGAYWAAAQIAWARDGGLMTGYYDGTFRPWAGTTRQELWMVLARLSGANPADMWAAREWAMNVGITDGTNPHSPLSRQQMIAMLYRYASYRRMDLTAPSNLGYYRDGSSVSPYARTAMSWAANKAIITGDANGLLHPQDIATRADFAVYLYRFLQ